MTFHHGEPNVRRPREQNSAVCLPGSYYLNGPGNPASEEVGFEGDPKMPFAPELLGRLFGARRLANGPSTDGLWVETPKLKDEELPKRPFDMLPDFAGR